MLENGASSFRFSDLLTEIAMKEAVYYKNARIFKNGKHFVKGGFSVSGDRFLEVFEGECREEGRDLQGAYVIPGLVDMHIHGAAGADFSDGDPEGLRKISEFLLKRGVTSFVPTSMTMPEEQLARVFETAAALSKEGNTGARILGIHMEGPFFSERKKGAQNSRWLREPDPDMFRRLQEIAGGLIRGVDVAPELAGALDFACTFSGECLVSAGHTDASCEDAERFFRSGGRHVTHLFNGMPQLLSRAPGVIGAASENPGVTAELIADGIHVHPSAVRAAFRLFPERICLISDALRALGMPDGRYMLGGQEFILERGEARLPDGTIAGAVSDLFENLRRAIAFGIPEEEAVRAATLNPADALGLSSEVGRIAEGCFADFIVLGEGFSRKEVYLGGIRRECTKD